VNQRAGSVACSVRGSLWLDSLGSPSGRGQVGGALLEHAARGELPRGLDFPALAQSAAAPPLTARLTGCASSPFGAFACLSGLAWLFGTRSVIIQYTLSHTHRTPYRDATGRRAGGVGCTRGRSVGGRGGPRPPADGRAGRGGGAFRPRKRTRRSGGRAGSRAAPGQPARAAAGVCRGAPCRCGQPSAAPRVAERRRRQRRGAACTGRSRAPTDASLRRFVRPRPLIVDANSKLTSSAPKFVLPARRRAARHALRRAGAQ